MSIKKSTLLVILGLIFPNICTEQLKTAQPQNLIKFDQTIQIDPLQFNIQTYKSQYLTQIPEYKTINGQQVPMVYSTYTPSQTTMYTSYQLPLITDRLRSVRTAQAKISQSTVNNQKGQKVTGTTNTVSTEPTGINTGKQSGMLKKEEKSKNTKGALNNKLTREERILKRQQRRQMRAGK